MSNAIAAFPLSDRIPRPGADLGDEPGTSTTAESASRRGLADVGVLGRERNAAKGRDRRRRYRGRVRAWRWMLLVHVLAPYAAPACASPPAAAGSANASEAPREARSSLAAKAGAPSPAGRW